MSKIGEIFEGWKNHLSPDEYLRETIDKVSKSRLAICDECPFNSKNRKNYITLRTDVHCTACGCTLIPKSKCLSCKCPEDKWGPELTPEEDKIISDEKT